MLYSKANLAVASVASGNPYDGALCGVAFNADGSTTACNGEGLVAVGPARQDIYFPDVGPRAEPGEGFVLRPDFVKRVEAMVPKDRRVSLQHVALTQGQSPGKVEFTSADKSGAEERKADPPKRERYPDWRAAVRQAVPGHAKRGDSVLETARVCVSRRMLLRVLEAMDAAAGDGGADAPVYLELGRGLVLRAANRETGQRIVGVAVQHATPWPEPDAWETSVFVEPGEPKRINRFRTKRV